MVLIQRTEIFNQPNLWRETLKIIEDNEGKINKFIEDKYKENVQIIFSGAGTSAYIGEIIVPYLNKNVDGGDLEQ